MIDSGTRKIISIYREGIKELQGLNIPEISPAYKQVKEEIYRMQTHVERLENDHKDCVVLCCPGCKLGGIGVTCDEI